MKTLYKIPASVEKQAERTLHAIHLRNEPRHCGPCRDASR